MINLRVASRLAILASLAVGVSGCSTLGGLWPWHDNKPNEVKATVGKRVSIIQFDKKVEAADALKGVDFYIPAPQPVTSWTQPGGVQEQSIEHVEAGKDLTVVWKHSIGKGDGRDSQLTSPLIGDDGKIFVMDGNVGVEAIDAKTGSLIWRQNLDPKDPRDSNLYGGGLAIADGKLFATSGYRLVAAMDEKTGAVIWRKRVASPIHGAPTAANGRVFVVDIDNQLIAFDQDTGEQAWTFQGIVEPARILRASSPAVASDYLIAPFSSGELVAIRTSNGNVLWNEVLSQTNRTNALSEIRDIAGRPVIYKGQVFAASHAGVFAAVDVRTGERKWEIPASSVNTPWVAGDVVYLVTLSSQLIAANRESGLVYWMTDLNKGYKEKKQGQFLGTGGYVVHPIWTGPLLASGRLLLVNSEGELVAVDAKTGVVGKKVSIGARGFMSPIAMNGLVYVLTEKGELIAFR